MPEKQIVTVGWTDRPTDGHSEFQNSAQAKQGWMHVVKWVRVGRGSNVEGQSGSLAGMAT